MSQIVCDPSSGSTELCLTETTPGGSHISFVFLVGVWQRNFEPAVCVHGTSGWELVPSQEHLLSSVVADELAVAAAVTVVVAAVVVVVVVAAAAAVTVVVAAAVVVVAAAAVAAAAAAAPAAP